MDGFAAARPSAARRRGTWRLKNKNIKGVRLIVAAIVLFFIVFVILRLYFEESKNFSPLALKSNTVIFGLWIIIILFGLTFLFILARNILKMYLERNQGGAVHGFKNRHEKLTPNMSALIIGDHVKRGLDLAEQIKLPSIVRRGIPEHTRHSAHTTTARNIGMAMRAVAGICRKGMMPGTLHR